MLDQVDKLPTNTNCLCDLLVFICTATTKEIITLAIEEQAPSTEVGRELSSGIGTLDLVMPHFGAWHITCTQLPCSEACLLSADVSCHLHLPLWEVLMALRIACSTYT